MEEEQGRRKYSLLALLLTLLLTVGTLALLLVTKLHCQYMPHSNELAQLKQDSIMFGGEFVQLGNTMELMDDEVIDDDAADEPAAPDDGQQPDIEADDLEDAGEVNQKTPPVVKQEKESPMKVKEPPKKEEEPPKPAGPTNKNDKKVEKPKAKVNNAEAKETKTKKADSETKTKAPSAAENKVKNAFGSGSGKGGGKQGSPGGNTSQGVLTGAPSIGGLTGYTLESWAKPVPNSKWSGRVTVKVNVSPRGQVTKATATSATGDLASHPEVRRACEQAALKSRFSVPKNTTTEGIGTVTYIWR